MKQSEIKEGKMYSDGKTARVVAFEGVWGELTYVTSRDNFMVERFTRVNSFAKWAKYECVVELQLV